MEIIIMLSRILLVVILVLVYIKMSGHYTPSHKKADYLQGLIEDMYPVLCELESSGRADAVGDNGRAFGILQIHKVVVQDVNRFCDTDYQHNEMFDPQYAKEVYQLYLERGAALYQVKMKADPKEQDLVRMWNGGIYDGYEKQATLKYYSKYLRIKDMLEGEDPDHAFQNQVAKIMRHER